MELVTSIVKEARDLLANFKLLCNDATENNRNTLLAAILLALLRLKPA